MRRGTLFGLVIFLLGILYLLVQMGAVHLNADFLSGPVLWPLLLVVIGLYGMTKRRRGRSGSSVFLFVYGILLSLKDTRQFPWLNHIGGWSLFFGVVIVIIGISFLLPRRFRFRIDPVVVIRGNRRDRTTDDHADGIEVKHSRRFRQSRRHGGRDWRLIGDLSIGKSPWVLQDMNLWNGIGDIRVNLVNAHIDEGTYTIDVRGWIGEVRVLVPEGLSVCVDADVSVGNVEVFGESHAGTGRSVHLEDLGFAEANRRCVLRIDLNIGDVEVVRVP